MKFISGKKPGNEPKTVQEKRMTPGSTFDGLPKEPLRLALLSEQGHICAYCMQRVKNSGKTTKIEHWSPRNKTNELDYMNLLAVCNGGAGRLKAEIHCDTLKKNTPISISPLNANCEKLVRFDPGGHIYSEDEIIDKELKTILGLDLQHLVEERRQLMDLVKSNINTIAKQNPDNKIKKNDLNAMLKEWQNPIEGKFEPFCQVAIHYIQKKIARLS